MASKYGRGGRFGRWRNFHGNRSEGSATGAGTTYRGTGNCDVYPVLFFGRDAFGIVPLKGKSSMTPMVVNPKPAPGDPLAQRGTVGWKLYTSTVILQDAFMARLEVCATL